MGNWNISIQGVGFHHNHPARTDDADIMAEEFVRQLIEAGHTVEAASITHGGKQDLMPDVEGGA